MLIPIAAAGGKITPAGDTTAPVFAASSYNDATQSLAATITEANPDTLHWVLVTNPSAPSAPQIIAGTGGGILEAGSEAYSGGFTGTISVTNEAGNEIHLVATDVAGNQSAIEVITGVTVDNTAPTFSSSVPADDATDIAVDSNIAVTFSENIAAPASGGEFYLYDDIDTTPVLVETFDVDAGTGDNGGTLSIATDTVTLNPGANMDTSTQHSVRWNAGAVEDAYGNPVAANAGDTLLNFTTAASGQTDLMAGVGDFSSATGWSGESATLDITGGVLDVNTVANFDSIDRLSGFRIPCSGGQVLDLEFNMVSLTTAQRVRFALESHDSGGSTLSDRTTIFDTNSDGAITAGITSKLSAFTTHASAASLEVQIEFTIAGFVGQMDDVKLLVQ